MSFENTHLPCDDCGSSDGLATNEDGSTYCFSCETHTPGKNVTRKKKKNMNEGNLKFISGICKDLVKRKIPEKVCQKYQYFTGNISGEPCQIADYYDEQGNIYAQKIRKPGKDFFCVGNPTTLWGQQLFNPKKQRKLFITEGEIDAMSLYHALSAKSAAVVSVPKGAQSAPKAVGQSLEWIEQFDEVTFVFDMDEPGRKAARQCAAMISPLKARLADLPMKDPSEMVKNRKKGDLVEAVLNAREFRPDGIVSGEAIWDKIVNDKCNKGFSYPWKCVTTKTRGLRRGEVVLITAGSGIGKSTICREMAYHLTQKHEETVGYIALEENVAKTGKSILGIHLNRVLHLEEDLDWESEEIRKAFEETIGLGRFYTYDHFGSLNFDNLKNKIRYMVKGLGCNWIFLDHISIVVSGMEGDERKCLDKIMTDARTLAEEIECGMILVSHLKRPPGTGHEEGAAVSLSQLRGSAGIGQLADMCIGGERNQQDDSVKNKVRLRSLKNRHSGETGVIGVLEYVAETGRLIEADQSVVDSYDDDVSKAQDFADGYQYEEGFSDSSIDEEDEEETDDLIEEEI